RAEEYLERLARDATGDEALAGELATAYARLADIQGGPNASLGDRAGAQASMRKALALREAAVARHPDDAAALRALANALSRTEDVGGADGGGNAERAMTIREALLARAPDDPVALRDVARSHFQLASNLSDRGKHDAALAHHLEAQKVWERMAAANPNDE